MAAPKPVVAMTLPSSIRASVTPNREPSLSVSSKKVGPGLWIANQIRIETEGDNPRPIDFDRLTLDLDLDLVLVQAQEPSDKPVTVHGQPHDFGQSTGKARTCSQR